MPPVVAVACSGGRDSTALLHCVARQAPSLGVRVVALHVHHGLMPEADAWLRQVRAQARRWGAGFASERLLGQPPAGDSVEAWAREHRYAALARMAHQAGAALVLLAHHRQDQAETWLLQALRGAGAAGLSCMPGLAERLGVTWARPWLHLPRSAIQAYLQRHRLRWVEDTSNTDARWARSHLRTAVWPVLQATFPGAEAALAAAASHAQEAAALAAEVAMADLPAVCEGDALQLAPWLRLPPARRGNALRAWLQRRLGQPAPRTLVQRLLRELPGQTVGHWPAPGHASLRLYRGALRLERGAQWLGAPSQHSAAECAANADAPAPGLRAQDGESPGPAALLHRLAGIDLCRPGQHRLPGGAALHIDDAGQGGLALAVLQSARWRPRSGGETFQRTPHGVARSLKKAFQAAAVPAWQRHAPLLCAPDGRVLYVPGLGVDARCLAGPGQAQHVLDWQLLRADALQLRMPPGAGVAGRGVPAPHPVAAAPSDGPQAGHGLCSATVPGQLTA